LRSQEPNILAKHVVGKSTSSEQVRNGVVPSAKGRGNEDSSSVVNAVRGQVLSLGKGGSI
jgi:hypothetical protein